MALENEIMLSVNFIEDEIIETIYIGGGTPSLLSAEALTHIFFVLRKRFTIAVDAEITLEANPDDINNSMLTCWKMLGINRLSVGLQSFNETELKWMNRAHNAAQSLLCLDEIKEAGFTNFSADLIYGSPLQSMDDLRRNFEILSQRNVPHISCYALTVEPKTALNKLINEKSSPAIDPDMQAAQFSLLLDLMDAAGYEQYEISNFCRPGYRSRHNSSYWQGKPYFGFGPSAHSYNGKDTRRWNIANNGLYIQSLEKKMIPFEEEILTADQRLNEYVMTALRTAEGISLQRIEDDFGTDHSQRILGEAEKYIRTEKLIIENGFVRLTKEGKFLADGIASQLFT